MDEPCFIKGCSRPQRAKGLCGAHYQRARRVGDVVAERKIGEGKSLLWIRQNADTQSDECIEWPFRISKKGYGQLGVGGKNRLAHRESCAIFNGPPPSPDHQAAHSCGRRSCVNPRHLRWALPVENSADKLQHGTHLSGEDCPQAKLTNAQAAMIRKDHRPQRVIAKEYGVDQKSVQLIKARKTYPSAALGMA